MTKEDRILGNRNRSLGGIEAITAARKLNEDIHLVNTFKQAEARNMYDKRTSA